MTTRTRRHHQIAVLLASGPVPSQEDLQAALEAQGVVATQATISRDLREMGAVKGPRGYVLAETLLAAVPGGSAASAVVGFALEGSPRLDQVVRDFVVSTELAGTMIVLKTGPGQAQVVALELDRTPPAGVMGTIGGDDTIFVACKSEMHARKIVKGLKNAANLN